MLATFLVAFAIVPLVLPPRVTPMDIQGREHASPYSGERVITRGVVTARGAFTFYLHDAVGDNDPGTSNAVRVAAPAGVNVRVGDGVEVEGRVEETPPGGDHDLPVTEVIATRVVIVARGQALPAPVVIGRAGRMPPRAVMDDDGLSEFQPGRDGIDFWESLEGMRVVIEDARTVAVPTSFGDAWVVPARVATGLSARGSLVVQALDANPERLRVRGALRVAGVSTLPVGTRFDELTGVVDYAGGSYELLPTQLVVGVATPPDAGVTSLGSDATHITVASMNLRNFGPTDPRASRIARTITEALGAPDIVVVQEIQDDSGETNDGTVTSDATRERLQSAIVAAGGPDYGSVDIPPVDGRDGGVPGGNIRVAMLYRTDRVQLLTTKLISPELAAWNDSRKPLAAGFLVGGARVTVVGVHFRSRSGSTPDFGAVQPPDDPGATQRALQARAVHAFVASYLRDDPQARIVVIGDFNDETFSRPLALLEDGAILRNLARALPGVERYTYSFDGNAHAYDHILASRSLAVGAELDIVHVNAEFPDGVSDHDPVVARLRLVQPVEEPPPIKPAGPFPNPFAGSVCIETGSPEGVARIGVFDARGRRVWEATTTQPALEWDGRDQHGRPVPSGVYFARVECRGVVTVRRLVRVR